MSAPPQDPDSPFDPSQHHSDGSTHELVTQAVDASPPADQHVDIGSLIRAALVDGPQADQAVMPSGSSDMDAMGLGDHAYDGHVPLAFDSDLLPAIGSTLDLLTTSTDLFDVPVADFSPSLGDTADT